MVAAAAASSSVDDGSTLTHRRQRHASQQSRTSTESGSVVGGGGGERKHSFAQQRKQQAELGPLARRVHRPQDSLFSSSSGWTNYRGFFNLSILLLVISNGRVALENIIKYGILVTPLQWLSLALEDLSWHRWPNAGLILASNITLLTVLGCERMLERGWLGNRFAAVFYPVLVTTHLAVPAAITLVMKGNPLYSAGTLTIYVIEALKIVSYVHVMYWCRCARAVKSVDGVSDKKSGHVEISKDDTVHLYPDALRVKSLYYFMLAPTLCFELRFPRSPRRRKSFLIKRACELTFFTFLIAALVQQWVVPLARNSMACFSDMELGRMLERVLKLAIPNHFIWLIFFYTVFHSALNLLAEVLRFADREFYRDFWNAETIQYFWKTWNIPVHRWALRHIYLPMTRNGYGRNWAMSVVFFVSAFFHEYLVSIPLSMFRLWAYYGMMAQLPLSFITEKVVKGGRAGNIVVWLGLILGQPMAILMYVHDYYVLNQAAAGGNATATVVV